MKIIERIFDAETGSTTDVERDMTEQEFTIYQADIIEAELKAQQDAAKAQAKASAEAKLAALGLTADDLRALGL